MSTEETVTPQKTKLELINEMKELQQSYSRCAALLKDINFKEEHKEYSDRQMARLEAYKAKYKFYAQTDGTVKPIDWDEVQKLIQTSIDNPGSRTGYALGFDSSGMEGLGYDYGNGGTFSPMVEEEADARKYVEREKLMREWKENAKTNKR